MSGAARFEGDAAADAAMIAHLTPPLAAGAARSVFAVAADGSVTLPAARRPTVLLGLRQDLQADALSVTVTPQDESLPLSLRFAGWSEAGSVLAVEAAEAAAERGYALAATLGGAAVDPAKLTDWLELVLIEGNLGRLIAVLGTEQVRLRREIRRLRALRCIATAEVDALDRIGAELGLPRLDGRLGWDQEASQITVRQERETDPDYRVRLGLFRPFLAPTRPAVADLLQSAFPGIAVREPGDPLAVAVKLIGVGDDAPRQALLAQLRAERMVFLAEGEPGDAIHAARPMTAAGRTRLAAMRLRLAAAFQSAPDAAVAPRLADALDRAGRLWRAVGGPKLDVTRAQDAAGGSRFELGLGVAVALPGAEAAAAARAALLAGAAAPADDPETAAVLDAARAAEAARGDAADDALAWLWRAAGLATAHRIDAGSIYLSHLATAGLVIDAPDTVQEAASLRAVFNAPGDPATTAALVAALDRAQAADPGRFTPLDAAAAQPLWQAAQDLPPAAPASAILAGAGLPVPSQAAPTVAALGQLAPEVLATLQLEAGLAAQIRAGDPQAIAPLQAVVAALRAAGVVSLLPLVTPAEVLLVAGAVALPVAGVNLGERRATGIRWAVEPLGGQAQIAPLGFRSVLRAAQPGLIAVTALGYVRDGAPDPYEFRVEFPDGTVLDLPAYERLMNALERCFPVGIEVNTWALRTAHVDLNNDGAPDRLPPQLARHYRRFRMPRLRGLTEPDLLQ